MATKLTSADKGLLSDCGIEPFDEAPIPWADISGPMKEPSFSLSVLDDAIERAKLADRDHELLGGSSLLHSALCMGGCGRLAWQCSCGNGR